jgi:U6 snRNA-associated Sm-like protein LSm7
MANLGLSIRIPKESLIKLGEMQGKELVVKFNGGREVAGRLKSWDKAMNLILEGTQEMLGVEEGVESTRVLGLVIVKGSQVGLWLARSRVFACAMGTRSLRTLTRRAGRRSSDV